MVPRRVVGADNAAEEGRGCLWPLRGRGPGSFSPTPGPIFLPTSNIGKIIPAMHANMTYKFYKCALSQGKHLKADTEINILGGEYRTATRFLKFSPCTPRRSWLGPSGLEATALGPLWGARWGLALCWGLGGHGTGPSQQEPIG